MRAPAGGYRADIDGLRAIAVSTVVAFHFFPQTAHGGFVGVDIFFVISGFLITSMVAEDLDTGVFSFLDFYTRRARRIFPALGIVLASSLLAGAFLFDPSEFRALGLNVVAGVGFVSNMLLWAQSGYFDEAAEFKPLLHLWSLAIEEQFYILWPLALFLAARAKARPWRLALLGWIGSFALNIYVSRTDVVADFYFVLTRIWELLIGALLALSASKGLAKSPRAAGLAAVGGILLIAVAVASTRPDQTFPGWRALLPTCGAAMLIAAGPEASVNKLLLSRRAMVGIGKISYPLYLWHWPLLSFARISVGGHVGPPVGWALIALSVALATLTYRYLETPIRRRTGAANTSLVVAAMLALGLIGLRDWRAGGLLFPNATFVNIVNAGDLGETKFRREMEARSFPCCAGLGEPPTQEGRNGHTRGQSQAQGAPDILLLGDSHADQLYLGLATALAGHNVGYYAITALPLPSNPSFAAVYDALAREPAVKTVIIANFWSQRVKSLAKSERLSSSLDKALKILLAANKRVYIVNDAPAFSFRPSRCKFAGRLGVPLKCAEPISVLNGQLASYASELSSAVAANPGVTLIDISRLPCSGETCSMAREGKLLYRDDNHFNAEGSRLAGAAIVAQHPEIGN